MNNKDIPISVLKRVEKMEDKFLYHWCEDFNNNIYIFCKDYNNCKYLIDGEKEILLPSKISLINPSVEKKDKFYIINSYCSPVLIKDYKSAYDDNDYELFTLKDGFEHTYFLSFEGKIINEYNSLEGGTNFPDNLYVAPSSQGKGYSLYDTDGKELIKNKSLFHRIFNFILVEHKKTMEIFDLNCNYIKELSDCGIMYSNYNGGYGYELRLKYGYILREQDLTYGKKEKQTYINVCKTFVNEPKLTDFLITKKRVKENLFCKNNDSKINKYGAKYIKTNKKVCAFSFKDGYDVLYGCIDLFGNEILECKYNFDDFINIIREKHIISEDNFEKLYSETSETGW